MTAEQIASLRAGGHSVLAHRYNDIAECPACSPAEACGEDHIIGTKPETCFACLAEQRDELLSCLRRMCGMYGAYSKRLAPLLAEDKGTVWTFERANELACDAIAKAEGGRTEAR